MSLFRNIQSKISPVQTIILKSAMSISKVSNSRYFIVTYKYPENVLDKRAPHREAHLKYASRFVNEGKLILGGPFMDPIDSAAVVLKVNDVKEAEDFCRADPYVINGVALGWTVREWNVVVGSKMDD